MAEQDAPPTEQPKRPVAAVVFFVLLFVGSLTAFGYVLWGFATDLVLGLLIAGMCRPMYVKLLPRVRGRTWLAATIVTFAVSVLVAVPTVFLVTSLSRQAASAYAASRDSLSVAGLQDALFGDGVLAQQARAAADAMGVEYTPERLRDMVGEAAGGTASFLSKRLNALLANVFSALYHFTIMLLIVFYTLIDGANLKRRIFDLSPLPDEEEQLIVDTFKDVGRAILFGNGIGSALQGALGGVAMWVVGLPSAVFWGTVMTIFAFLPLVGITVVVIPATLYLGLTGRWFAAVLFLSFCMVEALLIENVVKTKLIGDQMRMHSLLIFLSLLGGLGAFGILGILYGPLIVALFLTASQLYESAYRDRILAK